MPRALPLLHCQWASGRRCCHQPGGWGFSSGGQREFVPTLSRAAVSGGVSGLFIEVHENPDKAPSDGPNMLKMSELEPLLAKLIEIDKIIKT